mmetsp:Transcript_64299/g.114242  ORF Transcript_64299/g.114242 Transcript_64299/m.114242 type:complete len:190 (+) Transcript_64299:100-669(+)
MQVRWIDTLNPASSYIFLLALMFLALCIMGCFCCCYQTSIYLAHPQWGAIRKFDNDGVEDVRVCQNLIHEAAMKSKAQAKKDSESRFGDPLAGKPEYYGTIGPCTWGYCEAPNQYGQRMWDPKYGEVVLRHGFPDTQFMRAHAGTWARDEPHFMKEDGIQPVASGINDEGAKWAQQRMVVTHSPWAAKW